MVARAVRAQANYTLELKVKATPFTKISMYLTFATHADIPTTTVSGAHTGLMYGMRLL